MKASETVKNYPSRLRESANYAVRTIKHVCDTYGPRAPGSDSERKAQEYMREELAKCCDSSSVEEFPVHPNAFLGWVPICSVMMIAAAVSYFVGLSVVSLVLTLLAISFVVGEFVLYRQMIDFMFKKKISANAIGIRKPTGEVKRRIIFCGHCDSSNEWTYAHLGGPLLLKGVLGMSVVGFLVGLVFSLIAVFSGYAVSRPDGGFLTVLGYVFLGFIPFFFAASFFRHPKRVVIGANDNLSGSLASVAVAKFMQENDIRFENTEVRIVITGSEEAGLRGAAAYSKAHNEELKAIETVFCSTDTLKDMDYMAIYNRDRTGTVKHDERACALLKEGAARAGKDLNYELVILGASDSAAVTVAGIPATTLAAMDPAPARYYHTRLDTAELLDLKCIETGINILLETAFLFDEQGLKAQY